MIHQAANNTLHLESLDAAPLQIIDWRAVANLYRQVLFEHGQATEERRGFSPEQVRNVIEEEEDLRRDQLLRCRVRYFTDGVVLGGRAFVEEIFQAHRVQFGPKRKSGAQKMRGGDWAGLCTARDLRMRVIAVS